MNWLQALILGIIQGLSEFLPVSSSGHLEIGKVILGVEAQESLSFTIVVHGATVLSTIVVFWKDLLALFRGLFQFSWNLETQYIAKIVLSMLPVVVVGLFFKDQLEALFTGNVLLVGICLLFTGTLLGFTYFAKDRVKEVGWLDAIIIGFSQAIAVLPGISRSGSTIATGLLLGVKKEHMAKFSFLMVLVPIIGANVKAILDGSPSPDTAIATSSLIVGFLAAFLTGWAACTWMVNIVKRGKLIYFAMYCGVVGAIAVAWSLLY